MGIAYRIDKEKGITYVLWNNLVSAEEYLAHVRRLTSDPDWPPGRRLQLIDLRYASTDLSIDQKILELAADLYGSQREKIARLKAAIVADREFDKAKAFERSIQRYPASVIVFFDDMHTACTWLGINAKDAEGALQQMRSNQHPKPAR